MRRLYPPILSIPAQFTTLAGDGVVRVYRNYSGKTEDPVELVTAWRALNDRVKVKRGSGLVMHWQQDHGTLLAAGDTRNVRVWDVHRELCLQVWTASFFDSN